MGMRFEEYVVTGQNCAKEVKHKRKYSSVRELREYLATYFSLDQISGQQLRLYLENI